MSLDPFFDGALAAGYDALYRKRDVEGEVATVMRAADGWLPKPYSVLDLGCGTGRHIEELAGRGYRATGIDVSPALVDIARRRNPGERIEVADLRSYSLGESFDLAIALFGVLDYLPGISDVRRGLRQTAMHLRTGGMLYAVVSRAGAMQPEKQFVEVALEDGSQLLRWTSPSEYDHDRGVVKLTYDFLLLADGEVLARHREQHVMRGWTATELRLFLEEASFNVESLTTRGPTFHVLARRV